MGVVEDAGEEISGDFVCAGLSDRVTAGEIEEAIADFGVGGEERAEHGELCRATAVLEGVQIAPGRACAGAFASAWHLRDLRIQVSGRRREF